MFRRFSLSLVVVGAAALLACSSSAKSGSAPTIRDFVLAPTSLKVGVQTELNGTMTVEDVDGDIAGTSGEVTFPDGKIVPIQDVNLSAGNKTSIPVIYKIPQLPVPMAGEYVVSVQARDAEGNQSAKASIKLTAN